VAAIATSNLEKAPEIGQAVLDMPDARDFIASQGEVKIINLPEIKENS